jgi:hypothetical protein
MGRSTLLALESKVNIVVSASFGRDLTDATSRHLVLVRMKRGDANPQGAAFFLRTAHHNGILHLLSSVS